MPPNVTYSCVTWFCVMAAAGTLCRGYSEPPPRRAKPGGLLAPRQGRPVRLLNGPRATAGALLRPALTLLVPSDAADLDAGPAGFVRGPNASGWGGQEQSEPQWQDPLTSNQHRTPHPLQVGDGSRWSSVGKMEYAVFAGDRAWSLPPSLEPEAPGPAPGGLGTSRSSAAAHGLGWTLPDSDALLLTTGGGPRAVRRGRAAGTRALLLGFVDSDNDAAEPAPPHGTRPSFI